MRQQHALRVAPCTGVALPMHCRCTLRRPRANQRPADGLSISMGVKCRAKPCHAARCANTHRKTLSLPSVHGAGSEGGEGGAVHCGGQSVRGAGPGRQSLAGAAIRSALLRHPPPRDWLRRRAAARHGYRSYRCGQQSGRSRAPEVRRVGRPPRRAARRQAGAWRSP